MVEIAGALAERMRSEGGKVRSFFENMSDEAWNTRVYSDGECWTIRQVLAHFVATEEGFRALIQDILSGGPGAPENFDIDSYNERAVAGLQEETPEDLLTAFTRLREENASLVGVLKPDELEKTGRHPFLGITSMEDIIKLIYRHNQIHLRDVRRVK
jgi:uncharacterized damage-inducible protein DinB